MAKSWQDYGREWLDTLVVAISVAMAFRAYFYEPFNIPTGSMQPTLYGNHSEPCEEPGFWQQPFFSKLNWLVSGRDYKEFVTPATGVFAYADRGDGRLNLYFCPWNPGLQREFNFAAFEANPGAPVLTLPTDVCSPCSGAPLRLGPLAEKREVVFGPRFDGSPFKYAWTVASSPENPDARVYNPLVVPINYLLWRGYDTSGDFIFVNRWLWNFRQPGRGEVMIFATNGIRDIQQGTHYIKRLTALPGETIAIEEPDVFIDGKKIDPIKPMVGARGEVTPKPNAGGPRGMHAPVELGPGEYFACGDNSANSLDSRYWGAVPERNLKGTGSIVFWPIINPRWGNIK